MRARFFRTASLLVVFAGSLPAVDPQLMKLVMPDVNVMSDVNVLQARLSPFGQFLLSQMESAHLTELAALTGFDPRQDLIELLAVSNGTPGAATTLVLASGVFNPAKIIAAAQAAGATTETFNGVTILENPGKTESAAFLNASVMAAGSIANVKAAIGRQTAPATLPPALVTQANQLSVTQDAWTLSTISPAALIPAGSPKTPALGGMNLPANLLQQVQSGYAGVKFGANVAVTAQAQSDTAENATALANLLQFVANMAQMQAAKSPTAATFAKSISVSANGSIVNFSASVPEAQFQQLLTPKAAVKQHLQGERK